MNRHRSIARAVPLLLLFVTGGCAHAPAATRTVALADDVEVRRLTPTVWLHTTYADHQHGIATNGLLVATPGGSVLVDAGWNDAQAARLFAFAAEQLHAPVGDVIVTHAHADRIGGAGEARRRGARVHALERTIAHARERNQPVPDATVAERATLTVGGVALELLFPGAGHTDDNLVVYVPADRVLYGGCFLRSAAATDLGNIADADLAAWPESVRRVAAAWPNPAVVVPGHGALGGDPVRRTAELLAAHAAR